MGFFNILETFFFISLAITFVLIMMLVYHFKGRITVLEQKCDTMFDIMNNIVKELRTIKMNCNTQMNCNQNNETMMFNQHHNLGEIFKQFHNNVDIDVDIDVDDMDDMDDMDGHDGHDGHDGIDDDDENDEIEVDIPHDNDNVVFFEKIIVSDTEYEQPIKIINIDFNSENNLDELDEVDELDELDELDEVLDELDELDEVNEVNNDEPSEVDDVFRPDYKKMDTNYLRTMVISRGLATDTKKLKKNDLIRLLEQ